MFEKNRRKRSVGEHEQEEASPRITNKPANKNLILRLCAQALGHYRKAVASEPENVEALFCKAVVSAQLMELFDALKVGRCCSRCRRCSR